MIRHVILSLCFFTALSSSLDTAQASAILLTDMNAMECKVFEDPAFWRCDVWYEKALIYAGRDVGPNNANGDCVICRNVRAHALKNQLNVILNRDLNWDHPDFLMFTSEETLSGVWR
jgi:hypothetical protein